MKPLQMLPIAALVGSIFGTPVLAADEAATETTPVKAEIKEVRVKGQRNAPAAVERVNLGRIQQEMVRDNKDLVRYSTDVGLSDSGRHQKGFAVRGVEGNRVGVSIDGVNLPDSEENSLYARYGNFNSSRLSIDPELVRNIEIVKGADSFNTGSGALGGGVNYQTLQGHDLLLHERQFGVMMKNGYSSRNREWTNTLGFGLNNDRVDAALLYSQRRGHETESAGERGYPRVPAAERISVVLRAVFLTRPNINTTASWVRLLTKSTTTIVSAHLSTVSRATITRSKSLIT